MTCPRPACQGTMRHGYATGQTFTAGLPDFPGDTSQECVTMSAGGPGYLRPCLKCDQCGHSTTATDTPCGCYDG